MTSETGVHFEATSILYIWVVSAWLAFCLCTAMWFNALPEHSAEYSRFLSTNTASEWHSLWKALEKQQETITVSSRIVEKYNSSEEARSKIEEHILAYAFWVESVEVHEIEEWMGVLVDVRYFPQAGQMLEQYETAINAVVDSFGENQSPREIIEKIQFHLCTNVMHSQSGYTSGKTGYSALVEGRAIALGCAVAFNTLALLSGLDSHIATGYTASEDGTQVPSVWIAVNLGGFIYYSGVCSTDNSVNEILCYTETEMLSLGHSVTGEYAEMVRLQQ